MESDPRPVSERDSLAASLVNLSAAVDEYFSELPHPPANDNATILAKATASDPTLLAPELKRYLLKVRYQQSHAVLLLCSKDGGRVLMEDAGCSARLDRQVMAPLPCEFTLRVTEDCEVEGGDPE